MAKPYYQDDYVTIYHEDCREILPELPKVDLVLTDPPYENQKAIWFYHCQDWLCDRIVFTPGIDNVGLYPQPKWILCWHKPSGIGYSRVGGFTQWEPIFVYGHNYKFPQDYIYQIPLNFSTGPERKHPHPKPVNLIEQLIIASTKEVSFPFGA